MEFILAEAIGYQTHDGVPLLHAKQLPEDHPKHVAMRTLFEQEEIAFFFRLGDALRHLLDQKTPLVFVTDWTDPTEMIGLVLEHDHGSTTYSDLGFLAFYTDWDDLSQSGIERIFSHEFSHLWLHALGLDLANTPSVHFHTITAMTDPFLAFSEGFAEHLEILADELRGVEHPASGYDQGLDLESWLSYRDAALRIHAVQNNRFVYHTALDGLDLSADYALLHQLHITSSAFLPERIKDGLQMLSSEGVVATFFHRFRTDDSFSSLLPPSMMERFQDTHVPQDPLFHRYLKVFLAFQTMDWTKETLLVDFVLAYGRLFPSEWDAIVSLFLKTTHFTTIDRTHRSMFEKLYQVGRLGDPEQFKEQLLHVRARTTELIESVRSNPDLLHQDFPSSLWVTTQQPIRPVPWSTDTVRYRINLNTATVIDLLALDGVDLPLAQSLVHLRDTQHGFNSIEAFQEYLITQQAQRSSD